MPDYFRYTGPLNPEDENDRRVMVWREDLLSQLLLDVYNVDYPLIYGPYQIGKTTVAMQLIHKLAEEEHALDYLPVFLECGTLAGSSSRVVAHKLECTLLAALRGYLTRLRERMPDPAWDSVVLPDDPSGHESDFYRSQQIMQKIPEQFPKLKRLVLVVDEIESLKKEPLYETLSSFRSLHENYQKVGSSEFACCVVIPCRRNLAKLELGSGSPYNTAVTRYVPDLGPDKWRQAITSRLAPGFSEEALLRLFREVGGQPYLLQRVSGLAHSFAQSDGAAEVSERHVLNAIMTLSREGDDLLSILGSAVDERPERQDIVRRLLRGHLIPFDRMIDSHKDLSEVGLLVDSQGRLEFRNRLYQRVFMKQQYAKMNPPTGVRYLWKSGTLLPETSEVQLAVMNHDLREEVFGYVRGCGVGPEQGDDLAAVAEWCESAVRGSANPVVRDIDAESIRATVEYVTGKTAEEVSQMKSSAATAVARLLAEAFIGEAIGATGSPSQDVRSQRPPNHGAQSDLLSPLPSSPRRAGVLYSGVLWGAAFTTALCAICAFVAALRVLWQFGRQAWDIYPPLRAIGEGRGLADVALAGTVTAIILSLYGFVLMDFTQFVANSIHEAKDPRRSEEEIRDQRLRAVLDLVLQAFLLALIGLIPCLEGYRPWGVGSDHSVLYPLIGLPVLVFLLVYVRYGPITSILRRRFTVPGQLNGDRHPV